MRLVRFLCGLLLIVPAVSLTRAGALLVASLRPDSLSGVPWDAWALPGGFALWLLVFFALPKPTRSYVLAHELTHALWALALGAGVSAVRVGAESGSVRLSGRSSFLITLAPYFFPLYTILVIAVYYALGMFVRVGDYEPLWLMLVGLTWGFHLTFTLATLTRHQDDIQACGRLFSYAVIVIMNVLGITLWVIMVSSAELEQWIGLLAAERRWWADLAFRLARQ